LTLGTLLTYNSRFWAVGGRTLRVSKRSDRVSVVSIVEVVRGKRPAEKKHLAVRTTLTPPPLNKSKKWVLSPGGLVW
jgi:hypothetical protein